jgi:hypothetical protein
MPLEEGIVGQTIPVHDGRAAEPLSALRYVEIDVRVGFRGSRRGPFRRPLKSMMRFTRCRNLGETLALR